MIQNLTCHQDEETHSLTFEALGGGVPMISYDQRQGLHGQVARCCRSSTQGLRQLQQCGTDVPGRSLKLVNSECFWMLQQTTFLAHWYFAGGKFAMLSKRQSSAESLMVARKYGTPIMDLQMVGSPYNKDPNKAHADMSRFAEAKVRAWRIGRGGSGEPPPGQLGHLRCCSKMRGASMGIRLFGYVEL